MPKQGMTLRTYLKLTSASQHRLHATVAAATVLRQARCRCSHLRSSRRQRRSVRRAHRRGPEAVPVVRPLASRKVVMPLVSMVAVPVVRPVPSRNVLVPLLSVVTVPIVRPLASRKVVCCDWAGRLAARTRTRANMMVRIVVSSQYGSGGGTGSAQPGGTQPLGTYGP